MAEDSFRKKKEKKRKKFTADKVSRKGRKGALALPPPSARAGFSVRGHKVHSGCHLQYSSPMTPGDAARARPPRLPSTRPRRPSPTTATDINKPSTFFPQPRTLTEGIYRGTARAGGKEVAEKARKGTKTPLLIRPSRTTAPRTLSLPMDAGLRASGEPSE